jgi:hypothetical protein
LKNQATKHFFFYIFLVRFSGSPGCVNWRTNLNVPFSCCVSELDSDGFGAEISRLNYHTHMNAIC